MASSKRTRPGRIASPQRLLTSIFGAPVKNVDGPRARLPSLRARIPPGPEQLKEHPLVTIDDQHVTIAARATARRSTLDEVRLRLRDIGNRVTGFTWNPVSLSLP